MSKINEIWENYKNSINEKKAAFLLKLRTILPEKVQLFLDDFEPKYAEYKKALCVTSLKPLYLYL